MNSMEKLIVLGGIGAFVAVILAVVFTPAHSSLPSQNISETAIPVPGIAGSTHEHAALLVRINDMTLNFQSQKYMLQAKDVHFEDSDAYIIHKHATGITLPYFLSTLRIFLTKDCIDFQNYDAPEKYCSDGERQLRMIVNGEEITSPDRYEIRNNDRILLYYGNESETKRQLYFNQVPKVPEFREKTLDELKTEVEELTGTSTSIGE